MKFVAPMPEQIATTTMGRSCYMKRQYFLSRLMTLIHMMSLPGPPSGAIISANPGCCISLVTCLV